MYFICPNFSETNQCQKIASLTTTGLNMKNATFTLPRPVRLHSSSSTHQVDEIELSQLFPECNNDTGPYCLSQKYYIRQRMDFLSKYYRHLWHSAILPLADVPDSHIFIGTFFRKVAVLRALVANVPIIFLRR